MRSQNIRKAFLPLLQTKRRRAQNEGRMQSATLRKAGGLSRVSAQSRRGLRAVIRRSTIEPQQHTSTQCKSLGNWTTDVAYTVRRTLLPTSPERPFNDSATCAGPRNPSPQTLIPELQTQGVSPADPEVSRWTKPSGAAAYNQSGLDGLANHFVATTHRQAKVLLHSRQTQSWCVYNRSARGEEPLLSLTARMFTNRRSTTGDSRGWPWM